MVAELAGTPNTRESMARDLTALGVRAGSALLVHASMRTLGWICGGPVAVVQALLDVLGPAGTLVVPTHTTDNSDPEHWRNPPVPRWWWPVIREHTPAYDPAVTPSQWMGKIAETVRTWPGARRSEHPHVSFAALGAEADLIVSGHQLDDMLGDASPIGEIFRRNGDVLLLGVDHGVNTSLHLAEYRQPDPPRCRNGASVRAEDGGRRWVWWQDVDVDGHDFAQLGAAYEASGGVIAVGKVGEADCRLMPQRPIVDFATTWLAGHRGRRPKVWRDGRRTGRLIT